MVPWLHSKHAMSSLLQLLMANLALVALLMSWRNNQGQIRQ
jgi:hypothetical protein